MPESTIQNIAIVGGGAMGCFFAARIAESGANVTLIDIDQDRLDILNRDGIEIDDDLGERIVPVLATTAGSFSAPVDLVVLFTKAMHSEMACRSVAHLAGPSTYALTLQNGIGNAEAMATVFSPERILVGATDYPADLTGLARVSSHGPGTIWIGAFERAPWPVVVELAGMLKRAGLNAVPDRHVDVIIWEKLAFNAALNPLAMVSGLTVGELDHPAGRHVAFAIIDEVIATASARGLALDRARIIAKVERAFSHHRDHKASMLQDRLLGRKTEIEAINGAIVLAAKAADIEAPVTGALADIVRLIEAAP